MVAYNIFLGQGITLGQGIGLGATPSGGGPAPGDITITYNEFVPGGGGPYSGGGMTSIEDGSGTGTGIIINSIHSGVAMAGLTAPNIAFVSANLPDSNPGPGGSGEIWTAHWSSGSTYSTTPVAIYYSSNGLFGAPTIVFWILDPADSMYHLGTAGTFNFPMTLTAGTTTTTFQA